MPDVDQAQQSAITSAPLECPINLLDFQKMFPDETASSIFGTDALARRFCLREVSQLGESLNTGVTYKEVYAVLDPTIDDKTSIM